MLRCLPPCAAASGSALRLQPQLPARHLSHLPLVGALRSHHTALSHTLHNYARGDERQCAKHRPKLSAGTTPHPSRNAAEKHSTHYHTSKKYFSSSPLSPSQSNAFHAVTGYAFAGKPRTRQDEEKMMQHFAGAEAASSPSQEKGSTKSTGPPSKPARQGFPSDTKIGAWVEATLKKGEAGEDAVLFEKMKGPGDIVFGVADGVGGWSEEGIDPALFSQSLMFHSAEYARQFYACPERLDDAEEEVVMSAEPASPLPSSPSDGTPTSMLEYAYRKTLKEEGVPAGSSTACILTFDASKGILRAANLGDSGFLVLRPAIGNEGENGSPKTSSSSAPPPAPSTVLLTVHHQSKPQTFGFNAPYQLSKLPAEYQSDNQIECTPSKANVWRERVLDGDLILVATDGFWDNVSVQEVLQLVQFIKDKHRTAFVDRMLDISNNFLAEEEDLANVLAHNLLSYALMCQFSTTKTSPFEREAARHGIRYPGGKVDDVAIIVSLIIER